MCVCVYNVLCPKVVFIEENIAPVKHLVFPDKEICKMRWKGVFQGGLLLCVIPEWTKVVLLYWDFPIILSRQDGHDLRIFWDFQKGS